VGELGVSVGELGVELGAGVGELGAGPGSEVPDGDALGVVAGDGEKGEGDLLGIGEAPMPAIDPEAGVLVLGWLLDLAPGDFPADEPVCELKIAIATVTMRREMRVIPGIEMRTLGRACLTYLCLGGTTSPRQEMSRRKVPG
jgi:hypothetical protein